MHCQGGVANACLLLRSLSRDSRKITESKFEIHLQKQKQRNGAVAVKCNMQCIKLCTSAFLSVGLGFGPQPM